MKNEQKPVCLLSCPSCLSVLNGLFFGCGFPTVEKVILVLLLLAVQPAAAQVTLSSQVDRDRITIGDRILYSVTITRDESLRVATPGLAANLGQFEIKDYQVHEPATVDGKLVEALEYTITTFDTGRYVIPPLPIGFMGADSSVHYLMTEPIPIYVESVAMGEAQDIRDIKGPIAIPRDVRRIILWSLAGLAVLLLAGGWYWWRKKQAGEPVLPGRTRPVKSAHEIALEEIRELCQTSLLTDEEIKQFHVRLSEVLRRYLEGRYFIKAVEMTTTDTMRAVAGVEMTTESRTLLRDIQERCDLVKFAKHRPDITEIEALTQHSMEFVNQTKVEIFGAIGALMEEVPVENEG